MENQDILEMLNRLGTALSAGDAAAVAECWDIPALVLSDDGARPVSARGEIEAFFASAIERYRSRGITSTKATLERVDHLSKVITAIDVLWPGFDSSGSPKGSVERSHYLLRSCADGRPRIRVALTRPTAN